MNDEVTKLSRGDEGEEEEGEEATTRLWYAPWKKIKKQSLKEKTVRGEHTLMKSIRSQYGQYDA